MVSWTEVLEGASPLSEEIIFRSWALDIMARVRGGHGGPRPEGASRRIFAKGVIGLANAILVVDRAIPAELAVDHFQPGVHLPAMLRLSNASPSLQADNVPDMRGFAMRIGMAGGRFHDLLLVNCPVAFARNARQSRDLVLAWASAPDMFLARVAQSMGESEAHRIARQMKDCFRLCASLAHERFWSAAPYLWGDRPARFELRPMAAAEPAEAALDHCGDGLSLDFARRLETGHIGYRLAVQPYVDAKHTPLEDASVDWLPEISRPIEIASLMIPRQNLEDAKAAALRRRTDMTAFDPWNAPPRFRPLGSLNRFRRIICEMSLQQRAIIEGGA
ncbi:MAG: hypothetical protein DI623_07295 [Sphingomonas sanxanigenens]|uniref:Catalase core domain-containing protein n=1 Tax=Sphingomonas sanxanigenens TaxID=397260 RepID=A0A2W5AAN0_9SPHN|nr:MAG: hypothetical protein DI623_07295 [Sphingomonas sanxanigenens]